MRIPYKSLDRGENICYNLYMHVYAYTNYTRVMMEKKNCGNEKHEAIVASVRDGAFKEETVLKMADIFKMLSEPSRLKIVLTLMKGECCVYHLVEAVGGSQSGVSHQLRTLKDKKILKSRKEAQSVYYSIANDHIMKMVEVAIEHTDCQ